MTDERLRLAMPDDQVCEACQAVVLSMEAHTEWHTRLMQTAKSRIDGVERRLTQKITALARQYEDLLGIEQVAKIDMIGRLEQVEGALGRIEAALPRIYARLSGVEDELDGRDRHAVVNMAGEAEGVIGEMQAALLRESQDAPEPDGDLLARLGTDAQAWAGEFLNTTSEGDRDDLYLFVSWFANAIEAGRSAGYDQQRRDSFLYNVASCGDCSATHRAVTLCPHHRAMVVLAREEVHGQ